jgi:hypothetical protein
MPLLTQSDALITQLLCEVEMTPPQHAARSDG